MPQEPARKDAYKTAEVCKATDVAPYVLKYWLTEFPCLADKDKNPNRIFSAREVAVIGRIRQLLYDEGFTIAGAKKKIEAELAAGNFDGGAKKKAAAAPASVPAPAPAAGPVAVAPLPAPPNPSVDPKKIARELREILKMLK
jgi:DNA-binding transcriptional MerR regulator